MQAILDRPENRLPRRRFYIRFRIEIGMRAEERPFEPKPEQRDPQERAFRRQELGRHLAHERHGNLHRLQLRY